jgi:hypothetical protein
VAIDGTKILASASKPSAVGHGQAEKTLHTLDVEIADLLAKADHADATPPQDGLTIPAEVQRRQERKAQLQRAKAEMEARAYARFQAEQAEHEAKLARRAEAAASGKPPRGRAPQAPDPAPQPKDQVNFTEPESRIVKTKDGFQQAHHAQAGVETASRLIVRPRVSQAANDKRELLPDVVAVRCHVLPNTLVVDSSFVSEAAVTAVELATPGLTILAALQREPHGRTVAQLKKRSDPPAPPPEAPFAERMRHRAATTAGRALYKLRQQTVEPVFGIIKEVLGFRRFSLRGLAKVTLEWELVCLAYNCQRLHRLGAALRAA